MLEIIFQDEQSRRNEKEVQDDDDDDDLVERGGPEGGMPAAYQYNVHQDYSGKMSDKTDLIIFFGLIFLKSRAEKLKI